MSTAQGERRLRLAATRALLYSLPINELFELPGRPHVVYQLRSYSNSSSSEEAALAARNDSPFLFKAFETGQIGPKRLARIHGDKPRVATIHEYLDWTVTAQAAEGDDELDFGGFRVLVILPRYRSGWPPPGGDVTAGDEPRKQPNAMGAPMNPMPALQTHGKPVTAATIRSGPGYLEIPFVATHENKRGRGYCRCIVEAIEAIARTLGLNKLMLCSTNDASVQATWQHLGFSYCPDEQMEEWDILHTDLVYLQNTTQMQKDVPPPRRFKPVVIKHEDFKQRSYAFVGHKRSQRPVGSTPAGSLPAASKQRVSSKRSERSERSESTSKEESLSVVVREQASGAASLVANGGAASSGGGGLRVPHLGTSPAAASAPAATPHAVRPPAEELQPVVPAAGAGQARDEGMAGGGPPTPQPADGGPLRPLHPHAPADAPSAQRHADRPGLDCAGVDGHGLLPLLAHEDQGRLAAGAGPSRMLWPNPGLAGSDGLGPGPPPAADARGGLMGGGGGSSGRDFARQGQGTNCGGGLIQLPMGPQQLTQQQQAVGTQLLPMGSQPMQQLQFPGGGFDGSQLAMRQGRSPGQQVQLQGGYSSLPLSLPGGPAHGMQSSLGLSQQGLPPGMHQQGLPHGMQQQGLLQGGQPGMPLNLQGGLPQGMQQGPLRNLSPGMQQGGHHSVQGGLLQGMQHLQGSQSGLPLGLQGAPLQGMHSGMHQGMQSGGQSNMPLTLQGPPLQSMQQGMHSGMPQNTQSGMQQGMHPGMHQGMQSGGQPGLPLSLQGGPLQGMQSGGQPGLPLSLQGGPLQGMQSGGQSNMPLTLQGPPLQSMHLGMQGGLPLGMQGGLSMNGRSGLSPGMQGGLHAGAQGGLPQNMQPGSMSLSRQPGLQSGMPLSLQGSSLGTGMQGGLQQGMQGGLQQGMQHGMLPGLHQGGMHMGQPGAQALSQVGGRPGLMPGVQGLHSEQQSGAMHLGLPGMRPPQQQGLVGPHQAMSMKFLPDHGAAFGGPGLLPDGAG